jgi:radical SAM superfamily enzyme YgiQ (UPF0313 family)
VPVIIDCHAPILSYGIITGVSSVILDTFGVSVRNIDDQSMDQAKEVVRRCRGFLAAPIVIGGAAYSIFPESALEYLGADMGIQGEGEAGFPMLLERIETRRDLAGIPGLHLPRRGLQGPLSFIR